MYSRFKSLESFGEEELENLKNSKVAVAGLGATGSAIAEHLARHGVNLILIDRDYLEMKDCYSSNLYEPEECERALPKAEIAGEKLSRLTRIESRVASLNPGNIGILSEADLVMDGTDNMETRFLIDEYCRKEGKTWIYTAALGEKGYSMLFDQKCFSCVFEETDPGVLETCESSGIMREVAAGTASISALKAVKYLSGKKVKEKLDTFSGESFEVESGGCEVCRQQSFPHLNSRNDSISVCGDSKYQLEKEISDRAIQKLKKEAESYMENDYLVKAEVSGREFTLFQSGRAIIEARDEGHAEAIFSEIVGV